MNVKILTTTSEKIKGVIGKKSIEDDEVFVFEDTKPDEQFHMMGVPFPIFILFLDKDYGILDMKKMEPESGRAKAPEGTIRAVEVSPNFVTENKLEKGACFNKLFSKNQIKSF